MNDTKIMNDICILSRQGVCLLDMQQVLDKARELGLSRLAGLVQRDLEANKVVDGEYYPAITALFGMQS